MRRGRITTADANLNRNYDKRVQNDEFTVSTTGQATTDRGIGKARLDAKVVKCDEGPTTSYRLGLCDREGAARGKAEAGRVDRDCFHQASGVEDTSPTRAADWSAQPQRDLRKYRCYRGIMNCRAC